MQPKSYMKLTIKKVGFNLLPTLTYFIFCLFQSSTIVCSEFYFYRVRLTKGTSKIICTIFSFGVALYPEF